MRGSVFMTLVLACFFPAVAAQQPAVPDLNPAGARLLFTAEASGVQIYRSIAGAGGALHWELEAPLARLSGEDGRTVLTHYAGPSWEAADGSKVVRDPAVAVVTARAPDPADIPWLLIAVTPDPAAGALAHVAYVERRDTHGGTAPATPPVRPGTEVGVPYTATYAFFERLGPPAKAGN
jgi:hypothetical protein